MRTPLLPMPVEVPVGAVLPYAGPINACTRSALAAQGWLFCDGAQVSAVTYPALYALIGPLYGTPVTQGDPPATLFYLPDYRGAFLRGVNQDATRPPDGKGLRDPDADTRLSARYGSSGQGEGNQGNSVGSQQLDAFQKHEHRYTQPQQTSEVPGDQAPPVQLGLATQPADTDGVVAAKGGDTPRAEAETRPLNVYVNFIIKAQATVLAPNAAAVAVCQNLKDCWGAAGSETCKGGGGTSS
ncbi:tail fiber protein [Pyxidicoccus parkwayensis]|jgi:rhizosphere induced protein|uniref:Tail fiber protein n=1 Tax=Pyxidicoccus parkwayensis TaxID=2813578 RepID=A0ABX7NWL2_9BACT|nr:phage tail protein [Pyxidicoccus parkwaysis]QSQ23312.1 tail fiber protein [Pyxidicoccus parkwaysis]